MEEKKGMGQDIELRLHPKHRQDLQKSGLSDETIIRAGIESIRPQDIARELGFNPSGILSAYRIPYPGFNGFCRYRVFCDEAYQERTAKYLQKKGTGNHLYITDKAKIVLADLDLPLYLVEGEKKALKATQEGLPCVGLAGLWSWMVKGGGLIPDFDKISLANRVINVVPDNDWLSPNRYGLKKNLRDAVYGLAQRLIEKGARVFIVELPGGAK
jgi:hypothetical protein